MSNKDYVYLTMYTNAYLIRFAVPIQWLSSYLSKNQISLINFIGSYTQQDSEKIYALATKENQLI